MSQQVWMWIAFIGTAVVLDMWWVHEVRTYKRWRSTASLQASGGAQGVGLTAPAVTWLQHRIGLSPATGTIPESDLFSLTIPSEVFLNPTAVMLLSGPALVVFSEWAAPGMTPAQRPVALATTGLGVMVFLTGVVAAALGRLPPLLAGSLARAGQWLGVRPAQVIFLILSPVFGLVAGLAAGDGLRMIHPVAAVVSWLVGMAYAIVGAWREPAGRRVNVSWWGAMGLAGLFCAAFLVRGTGTAQVPIALSGDEGSFGLDAASFVSGKIDNLFIVLYARNPSLYFFIQSVSISLLGQTSQALRVTSALAGALTVVCAYPIGKSLFGRRAGLFSALFLAFFSFHVHSSRIGMNNIWDGLGYLVTLGALWHGWHHERRWAFLVAGLGLGFTQYFYLTSRLLPVTMALWLAVAALIDRERFRRNLPNLVLMSLAAVAAVMPLAKYFANNGDLLVSRSRSLAIFGPWMEATVRATGQPAWWITAKRLALGIEAYASAPVITWYQNGYAILRPVPATLFLLGVGLLALRPRDAGAWLLYLWLLTMAIVAGVSMDTPAGHRYVAALPACALVVGYAVDRCVSLLAAAWRPAASAAGIVGLVLVGGICANEMYYYFYEFTPGYDWAGYGAMVAQRLADRLQGKSADWQVLYFGAPRMGYGSIPSLAYLAPQVQYVDMTQPWGSERNPSPASDKLVFVFLTGHEADLAAVQRDFPGGSLSQERWNFEDGLLFWLYEYPAGAG